MSKIDALIAELCPDGVEFKELHQLLDYTQPTKFIVSSTEYDDIYSIPVLTAGDTFILGYTNETDGLYSASKEIPVIIFDDFTTSFHWVDFTFKVKSSAMKMLTPKEGVNFRYVYYAMKNIRYMPTSHARQWIATYSNFQIPVPPLPVQEEIVRILDAFTALEAELEAELEARRQQYAYYRDELLSFGDDIQQKALIELASFKNGKGHEKNINADGAYVVVNSKFISTEGKIRKYSSEQLTPIYKNDILMVMSDLPNGKALAKCFLVDMDNKYTLNQRICALTVKDTNKMLATYLFYILNRNMQLLRFDNGVDQTNLRKDDILFIKIPLPPLEEQARIVAILDKFDALLNDLSSGLPAEIAARRQQYEHYRNKLLTFTERV